MKKDDDNRSKKFLESFVSHEIQICWARSAMHFGWITVNYFLDARELFFPEQELIWSTLDYYFWLSYDQWDNFFLALFSSCRRFCVSCPSSNQEPVSWSLYLLHCGLESTFYRVDLALTRTSRRDLLRNKSNNGMPYVICRHAKLFRVLRMDSYSKPFACVIISLIAIPLSLIW